MPAERSTKKNPSSTSLLSNKVEPCIICGKVVSRSSDIPRHMRKHDSSAKKLPCPWDGCDFSTLQKSNLDTHYRRHTQDRSFLCTDDPGCNFQTCDPASLLRHRKRLHGYIPRPSNGRKTAKVPTQRECESVSSMDSPLPQQDSLLFPDSSSPCSYNYAWDTSLLPELDFFSAEPEILQFQFPYQDQQEELKSKDFFLPLQIPNMEQIFPGYQTSGQLNGSHGLQIGLTDLELDTSGSGLDIRFDSGISWNTDSAPMTSSSCDFNSVLFDLTQPSPQPPVLATFTDAMYAQPHQAPSFTDPQTHTSPYSTDLSASGFDYFDHSQLTNLNHEVNSDFIDLTASGDYFDQCRWDFGFNPAFGIVQGSGSGFMF